MIWLKFTAGILRRRLSRLSNVLVYFFTHNCFDFLIRYRIKKSVPKVLVSDGNVKPDLTFSIDETVIDQHSVKAVFTFR